MLVALAGGCRQVPPVITLGERTITVDEVVAEARKPVYRSLHDDQLAQARAALHRLVTETVVTAPAISQEERAVLTRLEARQVQQQCVAVELKKLLVARYDPEQEVRQRFARHPERYTLPESFRLQMVFLPADVPDYQQLAATLLKQLQQRPDAFDDLARRYSRSATAANGGRTEPMPGSSVHPEMRAAVNRHRDSDQPFLVSIDRGCYLLRVLEHWPAPPADLRSSLAQVQAQVANELDAELRAEISEQVLQQHEIEVAEQRLAAPELQPDTVVYSVDGSQVTVRDLVPELSTERSGSNDQAAVPGPLVRRRLAEYRRWSEPALALGCTAPQDPPISHESLLSLRLPGLLRAHAETGMSEELAAFSQLHRQILVREPRFCFDLWVMPFAANPYRQHQRLQRLLGSPHPEDPAAVAKAGAQLQLRQWADTSRIDQYEPRLGQHLRTARTGELSPIIRSSRVHAFLAARLHDHEEQRPLSLDDAEDRKLIAAQLLESSPEQVADAFADHHLADQPDRDALLAACARVLAEDQHRPPATADGS